MAANPGLLTDWPWTPLGNFKHLLLAPWVAESLYSFLTKEKKERDYTNLMIFPFLLSRVLHNLVWISISRHRTAKGKNRIVDKNIEFEQVDRESNWDDQILLTGLIFYIFNATVPQLASHLRWWRIDGIVITALMHIGPVEFLYYWIHRALHHHYLYSRYHSHHHSSIVTEPITSVIHPFGEHIVYFMLFLIPILTTLFTATVSNVSVVGYVTYIDLMNNMGHCNFELIPTWLFFVFPPLKYIMYTPSFHSLHHTQFRTNYSLFMPIYDYIYGTWDRSTDTVHETSLGKEEDMADVVHLTHLTNSESVYHNRLGFASLASRPENPSGYMMCWLLLWPITCWWLVVNCIFGRTFIAEGNTFEKLKMQLWVVPRYKVQYLIKWEKEAINGLIEKAILDAEAKGTKVLSLGLLNKGEELNHNGELFIRRNPKLKIKVVDGSSLAVAIVVNSIPKETTQVLFRGNLTKVAYSIAFALCEKGIKVAVSTEREYEKLKLTITSQNNIVLNKSISQKIWIVGDGLTEEEQVKATKGTIFIPFSQLPPKKFRKDCSYHHTPAMEAPSSLHNVDSCENWLPRRALSASRIAGILHSLEAWNEHECGDFMFNIDKVWETGLKYGFRPLELPPVANFL